MTNVPFFERFFDCLELYVTQLCGKGFAALMKNILKIANEEVCSSTINPTTRDLLKREIVPGEAINLRRPMYLQ
ncbi:hypothetical protein Btru_032360 [Bulinus truncatus]|nr:hypothetical protein Btru_032360 [Bulinus truncatus]